MSEVSHHSRRSACSAVGLLVAALCNSSCDSSPQLTNSATQASRADSARENDTRHLDIERGPVHVTTVPTLSSCMTRSAREDSTAESQGKQVLSGIVVDEHGSPIANAVVRPLSLMGGGGQSPLSGFYSQPTGTNGRFQIMATTNLPSMLVLGVSAAGHYLDEHEILTAAATDPRIVLRRGGTIRGFVRDMGRFPQGVTVRITGVPSNICDAGPRLPDEGVVVFVESDGTFESPTLCPGVASVTLRAGYNPNDPVLLSISEVEVVAGGATTDPRLQGVSGDLATQRVYVSVNDEAGIPVEHSEVYYRVPHPLVFWRRAGWTDVRGMITVEALAYRNEAFGVDLIVLRDGFRPTAVVDAKESVRVTVHSAKSSSVRLALSDRSLRVPPRFGLSAVLRCTDGTPGQTFRVPDPRDIEGGEAEFDGDGILQFDRCPPGSYVAALKLRVKDAGRAWSIVLDAGGDASPILVDGDGASVESRLEVDADYILDYIRRVR